MESKILEFQKNNNIEKNYKIFEKFKDELFLNMTHTGEAINDLNIKQNIQIEIVSDNELIIEANLIKFSKFSELLKLFSEKHMLFKWNQMISIKEFSLVPFSLKVGILGKYTKDDLKEIFKKTGLKRLRICTNCNKCCKCDVCSKCHSKYYCSRECQVADWPKHKISCGKENDSKLFVLVDK